MSSNKSPLPYPRVNLFGKNFVVHLAEPGGSSGRPVSKGGAGFKTPFRSVPTEGKLGKLILFVGHLYLAIMLHITIDFCKFRWVIETKNMKI